MSRKRYHLQPRKMGVRILYMVDSVMKKRCRVRRWTLIQRVKHGGLAKGELGEQQVQRADPDWRPMRDWLASMRGERQGNTERRAAKGSRREQMRRKGVKATSYLDKWTKLSSTRVACRHTSSFKSSQRAG